MSIAVELSPELETRLRADAANRGVALESLVLETLRGHYAAPLSPDERRSLVKSLRGRVKGAHPTVDEFMTERSTEGSADTHK